jgi:3-hydroxyisobutyrate dehydrogenase-like beta-hydroxyacid dehydrogenase
MPEAAIACLSELPVMSPAAVAAGSLMIENQHAPLFPIALVEKDFRYVIDAALNASTAVPTSKAVHEVFQQAIAQGHGAQNITGVAQLYRRSPLQSG